MPLGRQYFVLVTLFEVAHSTPSIPDTCNSRGSHGFGLRCQWWTWSGSLNFPKSLRTEDLEPSGADFLRQRSQHCPRRPLSKPHGGHR